MLLQVVHKKQVLGFDRGIQISRINMKARGRFKQGLIFVSRCLDTMIKPEAQVVILFVKQPIFMTTQIKALLLFYFHWLHN